jgi:hypothetical protein
VPTDHRRARRPIVARREIPAPAEDVLTFLTEIENHVRLAPGSVEVLSLARRADLSVRAVVRLRGPLGVRRLAATELLPPLAPGVIEGRAAIGGGTFASIAWRVQMGAARTEVILCASIDETSRLDQVLLCLGGRRWLERRFVAALERLPEQLAQRPARLSQEAPARRAA